MSFGGGDTTYVSQPSSPSVGETTREAIQAQLETAPSLAQQEYALTSQYSPLYAQLQTQLQQQYGQQLGQSYYDMVSAANPYISAVEKQAAQDIMGRLGQSDEELLGAYQREFGAAEANAGRLGSPVGSVNMARQTVQAREAIKQSRINEALAISGKTPVTAAASIQPTTPNMTGSYVSPAMGMASSVYGTQAGMFNQYSSNQTAARGQNMQLLGSIIGAAGTGYGTYAGLRAS